jgi:hypothetical protein
MTTTRGDFANRQGFQKYFEVGAYSLAAFENEASMLADLHDP